MTDTPRTSVLFVDPSAAELYLPSLRTRCEVTSVSSYVHALRALRTFRPTLVITELALPDGDGVDVCREAKGLLPRGARVLVTTAATNRVPDALIAGCDGVLMKPYAPILLYTRINRMMPPGPNPRTAPTNVVHADRPCVSCGKPGIVSFDASSHNRMWYACLECRHVWMASWRGTAVPAPFSPVSGIIRPVESAAHTPATVPIRPAPDAARGGGPAAAAPNPVVDR